MKTIILICCTAACVLLAAGCGGGKNGASIAQVGSTTTATATASSSGALLAFSQCMRSNGVASFPDPQGYADGNPKLTVHNLGTGPRVMSALRACTHLLPTGNGSQQAPPSRQQIAAELSFARCMRSHGLANFPDPNGQGQLSVEMVIAQGIDVHSPAVLRIVTACLPASHGWLTPEKVRESIANAGR
ncbi:MAG: hypothetical protein JOY73_04500 [Actinobacteria bacterium]|nr:hypothetical protein [Actinomycetota bacterium]